MPTGQDRVDRHTKMCLKNGEFGRQNRGPLRQVVKERPFMLGLSSTTLLTGAAGTTPHPFRAGGWSQGVGGDRGVLGYPNFCCASYRA